MFVNLRLLMNGKIFHTHTYTHIYNSSNDNFLVEVSVVHRLLLFLKNDIHKNVWSDKK